MKIQIICGVKIGFIYEIEIGKFLIKIQSIIY